MSAFNFVVKAARLRWLRRAVLALCVLLVLFGLFGYLALPGIIKSQAEQAVATALHRKLTIERVEVRPFALAVAIHGARLYEADGQRVFASFQDLSVRVSTSSLIHLAPVVKEVHLSGPMVHLARTGPNHYSTDDIVAALKTVYDPEIPADIYELGLIYKIEIGDERGVAIEMSLTSPNCPAAQDLPIMVENAVSSVPGVKETKVAVVWDPPWDPSRMSDEARLVLNMW